MKAEYGKSASALVVSGRNREKVNINNKTNEEKEKKRSKKNIEPWKCHKKGHFASECGEKRGKEETKDRDECDCAFIGEQSGDVEKSQWAKCANLPCLSVGEVQEADQKDIWLTDSGASAHMTFRREWLEEYREDPRGDTVMLGDSEECDVVGRGNSENREIHKWDLAKIKNRECSERAEILKKFVFGGSVLGKGLLSSVRKGSC